MRIRLNRRAVVQVVLTVILSTLLYIAFVAGPQNPGAPFKGLVDRLLAPFGQDDGNRERLQDRLEHLRTLPAYRDAERSVGELNAARASLLKAAANDAEGTRHAVRDYRRTLDQVRLKLATLKGCVDRAEFQICSRDLFMPHSEMELAYAAIQECLLGILPRASPLPEDILP